MSAAQAWALYLLRRLGVGAQAILVLALLGGAFYALAWRPAAAQAEALARETQSLQARLRAAAAQRDGDTIVEDPLTRFYRVFPDTRVAVSALGKIHRHAQERGLELERGEYRLVDDQSGRLIAYQANLPVRGSYVQVRQFLAAILADLPYVALEEVAFERRRISDATIEAKVRLTLYIAREA